MRSMIGSVLLVLIAVVFPPAALDVDAAAAADVVVVAVAGAFLPSIVSNSSTYLDT